MPANRVKRSLRNGSRSRKKSSLNKTVEGQGINLGLLFLHSFVGSTRDTENHSVEYNSHLDITVIMESGSNTVILANICFEIEKSRIRRRTP